MPATFQIFLSILLLGFVSAQVSVPTAPAKKLAGEAWLGLGVSKPDETTMTQVPALPPGIGFVITSIDEAGPAKKAGVQEHDLFWKMNEQMLVNEGQLATLLRLARPGEEVTLSVFRKGEPIDLKITLGEAKADSDDVIRHMLNDSVMRHNDGALRTVNVEKKTATITNERGSARVSRVEDGDSVRILDRSGKVIFEGVVRGRPEYSTVPKEWRKQICAMRRGLNHALSAKAAPTRQPRPRIVPPPVGE